MACYHPVPAKKDPHGGPWTLNPPLDTDDAQVPCGHCIGCRADKAYDWTNRATHEARLWRENRFVTLTYDDEHLPPQLEPEHLTKFLKRLRRATTSNRKANQQRRKNILTDRNASIRYLACGEYGEKTLRPHYHINLFNCGFADEQTYSKDLRESPTLTEIWGHGSVKIGDFTPETAAYVAGYLVKSGRRTYYGIPDDDGVVTEIQSPFKRQSSRPAIGKSWLEKHHTDLQHGYLITEEGTHARIPRYYTRILLQKHSKTAQKIGDEKAKPKTQYNENNRPERRIAQEIIHENNQQQKGRTLE